MILHQGARVSEPASLEDKPAVVGTGLRILIVTENFLPKVDGVTRTLARLLEHLKESGHEVLVLGPSSSLTSYCGFEVCGAQVSIPLWFYPGLSLNFFRREFLKKARDFNPDVIHYVDPIWLSAQAQTILEYALPDCSAVASYHTNLARYAQDYGFGWLAETMWSLQRRLHGRCMATYCPSRSTQAMLHMHGFQNVDIWARGIDTSAFSPSRRKESLRQHWFGSLPPPEAPRNDIVITYVGRLSTEKNIDLLIHAFRKLQQALKSSQQSCATCHLVLVGEGPARQRLEAQTKDLSVTFAGYQKGSDLAEHFASSDIFAFPSHSETFGNVVLEAMASGLPVVGLRAEGVSNLVECGTTGYLLDLATLPGAHVPKGSLGIPSNVQQLFMPEAESFALAADKFADLLLSLVLDTPLRKHMSEQAIKYAATRTWDEAMVSLVNGYEMAAELTRFKRADKLFTSLSRTSSTASLLDVKVEDPPDNATVSEDGDPAEPAGHSSSNLLFGRPPLKVLLRRSTRTALRESISHRFKSRLQQKEYLLVGRETRRDTSERHYTGRFVLFIFALVWLLLLSEIFPTFRIPSVQDTMRLLSR